MIKTLVAIVITMASAGAVSAQTKSPQAPPSGTSQSQERRQTTLVAYTENDDWPPDNGTDKNYTNALRVTLERNYDMWRLAERMPKLFGWIPKHIDCSKVVPEDNPDLKCASSTWHVVGQQFYTPDDISISSLIPNDRPYAGWLYTGGAWKSSTSDTLVATDVYLGATGSASLGREVQTKWHALVGAQKPMGWDHQIGGRFGIVVGHDRRWAFDGTYGPLGDKKWLEFVPYVGGTAGNIMTDAYAGARLKIGFNVSRDWAETGIAPRLGRAADEPSPFELYVVVDGQARAMGYNAFIDAASAHNLDRRYGVADGGVGVGVRIKRFSAAYRIAFVTPEYTEALTHDYKALRFSFTIGA